MSLRRHVFNRCPECGSEVIVYAGDETGEVVCGLCGLVLAEYSMDTGPEWRAPTAEDKERKSRVGAPISILQADKGLPTIIARVGEDALGRKVAPSTWIHMQRLKKWQTLTRYQSSAERNLMQALTELDKISDKLHIPEDLQQEAAKIYRKALNRGLIRGRSIRAFVAASLYAACRIRGRPRSLKEIASVSFRKKGDIGRYYRLIIFELSLKVPLHDPKTYVRKIAAKANIPEKTQNTAIQLLSQAQKLEATAGKSPVGIAGAALYIACILTRVKRTQEELAKAAGVTEVTVRNLCKRLKTSLNYTLEDVGRLSAKFDVKHN